MVWERWKRLVYTGIYAIYKDNLIASGQCVPMLVVMDSGDVEAPFSPREGKDMNEERALYGASFME